MGLLTEIEEFIIALFARKAGKASQLQADKDAGQHEADKLGDAVAQARADAPSSDDAVAERMRKHTF